MASLIYNDKIITFYFGFPLIKHKIINKWPESTNVNELVIFHRLIIFQGRSWNYLVNGWLHILIKIKTNQLNKKVIRLKKCLLWLLNRENTEKSICLFAVQTCFFYNNKIINTSIVFQVFCLIQHCEEQGTGGPIAAEPPIIFHLKAELSFMNSRLLVAQ